MLSFIFREFWQDSTPMVTPLISVHFPHVTKEVCKKFTSMPVSNKYEGESNENRKTEIKIRNIAPLSYKLADMLPML
jgi:hypothetical protein